MASIRTRAPTAIEFYNAAKSAVVASGYSSELAWQSSVRLDQITETDLLRETSWVILNSGFKERIARRKFSHLSLVFGDWESAEFIVLNREQCVACALESFGHELKINAMANVAQIVHQLGFESVIDQIRVHPFGFLRTLPFIGPTTIWHLAKNLGLDVAKPDRHLVRLADRFGFQCVQRLCAHLSEESGDRIAVIDLVLWRFEAEQLASRSTPNSCVFH